MPASLEIAPRGPFSLRAAAGFGFGPTGGRGHEWDGVLRFAFALDGGGGHVGVELRQEAENGPVDALIDGGAAPELVRAQLERVLSLDQDGDAFVAIGRHDPVIGRLLAEFPGQRPVLFYSPYEAAAWSVISARQRGIPAATVLRSIAERFGESFELAGRRESAFPAPQRLLAAGSLEVPGLVAEKQLRLRGIAEAAAAGELDAAALRELGEERATASVLRLRGIGPFYAGLIVLRAAGFADAPLRVAEPKVLTYLGRLYGLGGAATLAQYEQIAEAWRPFRTWATVLVRLAGDRGAAPMAH